MGEIMEEALIEAGYRLIPLQDRQKRPLHNEWQSRTYSRDDLGKQVGLMIEPGMVDVDLEWPELRRIVTDGSYETLVWGRNGLATHYIYRADLPEKIKFELPKVTGAPVIEGPHPYTVCELCTSSEGEGYQAMMPRSVHPDGDELQWISEQLPCEVSAETLVAHFGFYAGIAVLARFYPG